jgi:hypothetical protein
MQAGVTEGTGPFTNPDHVGTVTPRWMCRMMMGTAAGPHWRSRQRAGSAATGCSRDPGAPGVHPGYRGERRGPDPLAATRGQSLSPVERDIIAAHVSRLNECEFCTRSHAATQPHFDGRYRPDLGSPWRRPPAGGMRLQALLHHATTSVPRRRINQRSPISRRGQDVRARRRSRQFGRYPAAVCRGA